MVDHSDAMTLMKVISDNHSETISRIGEVKAEVSGFKSSTIERLDDAERRINCIEEDVKSDKSWRRLQMFVFTPLISAASAIATHFGIKL